MSEVQWLKAYINVISMDRAKHINISFSGSFKYKCVKIILTLNSYIQTVFFMLLFFYFFKRPQFWFFYTFSCYVSKYANFVQFKPCYCHCSYEAFPKWSYIAFILSYIILLLFISCSQKVNIKFKSILLLYLMWPTLLLKKFGVSKIYLK